ncbi:MAG: transcription-repair coupling factor [Bacteroidia bacterium]|nr:transcription-repair coupling factor [Bacteroidia bacterium]
MILKELLAKYSQNQTFEALSLKWNAGAGHPVLCQGLAGSMRSFVLAAAWQKLKRCMLVILPDKEEALYLFNDLENITGEAQVHFFPSSYKKRYTSETHDPGGKLLRAEVLTRIQSGKNYPLIVTYPEAIIEKVVAASTLNTNTFSLGVGEQVSTDFLNELLYEYGFERVDFVTEPGQFAVRGGIIDLFSFSDASPYRIEFFGEEVESLRIFDPVTQVSEKTLNTIKIIPDVQGKILKEASSDFLDFIPANSLVWLQDPGLVETLINKEWQRVAEEYLPDDQISEPQAELFSRPDEIIASLGRFATVKSGNLAQQASGEVIQFKGSLQPSFNKNFKLITEHLRSLEKKGAKLYICSDSKRQIERLEAILEDIAPDIRFAVLSQALYKGFYDETLQVACFTDHQLFDRYHRYRLRDGYDRKEAISLKELSGLQPGDFVTHVDHGVGRYGGLEKIDVNGKEQEAIRLVYKDNDILYVSIHSLHRISKFSGKEGTDPKLNKLGSGAWAALKQKTKSKVKDIARDLIKLYAERKTKKGFSFQPDNYLQDELEASFIYEDTPDQNKATQEVKRDMENDAPMDRLVCGDVGFGKTEVAIRAAFKAVNDNKQVAVLVPTTILALQHNRTFTERLKDFPCKVDFINRFKSAKEQKQTLEELAEGKIDIIIGTHRLLSKDVKFRDLGLMIIDEEQKFGVAAKEKLKSIKVNVDTLTLTATPIPRTLHFSMMGARDLSVIQTPPPNRYPVQTELHTFNEEVIKQAIDFEMQRNGQVFFVHNRVQNITEIADMIRRLCPGISVAIGHGQMDGEALEKVMYSFIEGEFDVLVATTIIESGLDIPNANTIIINNAHLFGLSDLHQMRGRVGRSNKKAFCYLLSTPESLLSSEARKRLKAIEEFAELGSGFNIALRDLDIRGAGDVLGGEQSGFISEIGFDMYNKILDEAIAELKENEFTDVFKEELEQKKQSWAPDCQIDTDLELLIPDKYVSNIAERLLLYRELDDLDSEDALEKFAERLLDRFGKVPEQTIELMNAVRLRAIARDLGFEKIVLKQGTLVTYFISNQSSAFYSSIEFQKLMQIVARNKNTMRMKEKNNKLSLVLEKVKTIRQALDMLGKLRAEVQATPAT